MSDGWAIYDAGPGAIHRSIARMIDDALKPKPSPPRVVDEQYRGDPFVKLIECDGKFYALDESWLIEQEERLTREWRFDGR